MKFRWRLRITALLLALFLVGAGLAEPAALEDFESREDLALFDELPAEGADAIPGEVDEDALAPNSIEADLPGTSDAAAPEAAVQTDQGEDNPPEQAPEAEQGPEGDTDQSLQATALRLGVTDYLLKKDLSEATIRQALENLSKKPTPDLPAGTDRTGISPVVERAAAYIREHYHEPDLRIGGVCIACGISASRLSARFREEMDMTVNEYVTFIRMENAKRLLLAGKHKVYEVADMVGYRNQAYFSTIFQEHTGMKPNKYHE